MTVTTLSPTALYTSSMKMKIYNWEGQKIIFPTAELSKGLQINVGVLDIFAKTKSLDSSTPEKMLFFAAVLLN